MSGAGLLGLHAGQRLLIASGNPGKLAELRPLFAELGIDVQGQADLSIPEVAETGSTFVENALIKARHASRCSGLPALADDSGLCVDALDGAPGLYSARFAGRQGDDAANNQLLLQRLSDVPQERRRAHFVCVLALLRRADDPDPLLSVGRWYGRIALAPRGSRGFGYDPIFVDPELQCSAAELEPATKAERSHRGIALRTLMMHSSK